MLVSFWLVGCGGGGGSETPVQKCDDLLNAVCDRVQSCGMLLTGTAAPAGFHQDCVTQEQTAIDCTRSVAVTSSYDTCLSQVRGDSCNTFLTLDNAGDVQSVNLPASCDGAILQQ
jgi:hypothetical protein